MASRRRVKWIQKTFAKHKPGMFHRQLKIPSDEKIPCALVVKMSKTPIGSRVKNPTGTGKRTYRLTKLMKQRAVKHANIHCRRYRRRGTR